MSKKTSSKSKQQKATSRKTISSIKKPVAQSGSLAAAVKFENIILLIILAAISILIIVGPFKRGLFFQQELLPVHIISFGLFALWWVCKLIRKDGAFLKSPLDWSIFAFVIFYLLAFSFTAVNKRAALEEFLKVTNYFIIYLLVLDICKKKDLFSLWKKPKNKLIKQDIGQAKHNSERCHGDGSSVTVAQRQRSGGPSGKTMELSPWLSDSPPLGLLIILHILLLAGLAVALGGLGAAAGTLNIHGAYVDGRIHSPLQYPNTAAAYLTASFFLTLGLTTLIKKNWYIRPLYLAASSVVFITLILTYSRGAWLLLPFLSLLFLALIGRGERLRMALYIFLAVLANLPFIQPLDTAFRTGEAAGVWKYILLAVLISIVGGSLIELVLRLNVKFKLVLAGAALALVIIFSFLTLLPNLTDPLHPENTPVQPPGAELKDNIPQKPLSSFLNKLFPSAIYNRIVTIRSGDKSIEGRFNFYKDALKIIKDYPVLGAGGGGWRTLYFSYQSSRYFTTEVHNHFLQVWIETGFLGFLSFLSIWVFFILVFIRNHLNPSITLEHKKALVTSFIPAIALGAHSAFDFNLSLGAVSIFLFALLAVGSSLDTGDNYLSSALLKKINLPGRSWSSCLIGLLLSLILFFFSFSLWEGHKIGIAAERKAAEKDYVRAMELFESAVKKDPYNAMNYANLARIYEHLAAFKENEKNAPQLKEQAYFSFKKALVLEPYNTSYNLDMARILLARGQLQEGLSYINRATELQPYDTGVFIQAARAHLAVAEHYLNTGERVSAEKLLHDILLVEGRMADYHDNTAAIAYYLGQAAFLLDDYKKAEHCFSQVVLEDDNYLRSQVYLAVLLRKTGEDKLAEEIKGSFFQNEEMMALYKKLQLLQ